jgi:hypothetical protein
MTATADDILSIEEVCDETKLGKALIRRALAAGRNGAAAGLVGGLAPAAGGWRVTRRAMLAWVDAGMPGISERTPSEE